MSLTSERRDTLEKFWADGLSYAKIADKMGGFEHCQDGGRSAICGIVKRFRDEAKKKNDEKGVAFWTRRKAAQSSAVRNSRTRTRTARRPMTIHNGANLTGEGYKKVPEGFPEKIASLIRARASQEEVAQVCKRPFAKVQDFVRAHMIEHLAYLNALPETDAIAKAFAAELACAAHE